MRARPWPLVLSLALLAAPSPAAAERSCKEEIDAVCPDTAPGSSERVECVRASAEKLPERCRARMHRARNRLTAGMEALRASCRDEIDRHCDDVQRGGGRLQRCLRKLDDDQLGERCRDYLDLLDAHRERRKPQPSTEPGGTAGQDG